MMRELLDPRRFGFYSLQLFSHKVLRRLMVFPLGVLALTSPLPLVQGWFYQLRDRGSARILRRCAGRRHPPAGEDPAWDAARAPEVPVGALLLLHGQPRSAGRGVERTARLPHQALGACATDGCGTGPMSATTLPGEAPIDAIARPGMPAPGGAARSQEDGIPPEAAAERSGQVRRTSRSSCAAEPARQPLPVEKGVNFAIQVMVVGYLKVPTAQLAYALSYVELGESLATFGLDRSVTRFAPLYQERRDWGKFFKRS